MITPSFCPTATERVLPKLALDFTTASLDPRVTFTRTTDATHPATYVNTSGYITAAADNAPRFDYNPVTLACKGLLIEESRQNKILNSSDFSNGTWGKVGGGVVTDQTLAPNNELEADLFTEDSSNGRHFTGITSTVSITGAITVSCFVKKKDRRYIQLCVPTAASDSFSALFDLDTVSSTDSRVSNTIYAQTFTGATITAYGNGFYRLTLSGTTTATAAYFNIGHSNTSSFTGATISFNMISYTGDNASGTYIWGAQLEAGAFATSYIPTTSAALTRNADVATMTGTNFSDWYNATQGAIEVQYDIIGKTRTFGMAAQIDDGTNNNRIVNIGQEYQAPNVASGSYIATSGSTQMGVYPNTNLSVNTTYKNCISYQSNNCANAVNAVILTDNTVNVPTVNTLRIGNRISDGYLNGHIAKINYWIQRITDNETQAFSK